MFCRVLSQAKDVFDEVLLGAQSGQHNTAQLMLRIFYLLLPVRAVHPVSCLVGLTWIRRGLLPHPFRHRHRIPPAVLIDSGLALTPGLVESFEPLDPLSFSLSSLPFCGGSDAAVAAGAAVAACSSC